VISVFWFRRDLRLEDNTALQQALSNPMPVLPIFIFDKQITDELPHDDARITFIYNQLFEIHRQLETLGSGLLILKGNPLRIWNELISSFSINSVFFNKDYEPYALERDKSVINFLNKNNISTHSFKDQVIFEGNDVVKSDRSPYTVFTPYKRKWLEKFFEVGSGTTEILHGKNFYSHIHSFPSIEYLGFELSPLSVRDYDINDLSNYGETRNYPALDSTSHLSTHLRFGTVSIRKIIMQSIHNYPDFVSELIWREFFMQILFHFPRVTYENFKVKYNGIRWRNNENEFELWCAGKTGFPIVDAGMRQLNATGYMHNRVRMVTASFLCKHLLIDWKWGEAYFAEKLLDFELSSNNGNWQWAAGTGCDAAPYFRIFNPIEQQKKFDKEFTYIRKWVPEFGTDEYPEPVVDHSFARNRALETYRRGITQ